MACWRFPATSYARATLQAGQHQPGRNGGRGTDRVPSLKESTVDFPVKFTKLITAAKRYSAAARVVHRQSDAAVAGADSGLMRNHRKRGKARKLTLFARILEKV